MGTRHGDRAAQRRELGEQLRARTLAQTPLARHHALRIIGGHGARIDHLDVIAGGHVCGVVGDRWVEHALVAQEREVWRERLV